MGKKHVIQKTEKELIQENEKMEAKVQKETPVSTPLAGQVKEGRIYVSSSYNNTVITLTDAKGNVLAWSSAGSLGFKGTKKSTPFAASKIAEGLTQTIKKIGIQKISIFVKGVGSGRESAIRAFAGRGFDILSIVDVTPIPHNGCRPPKARRV